MTADKANEVKTRPSGNKSNTSSQQVKTLVTGAIALLVLSQFASIKIDFALYPWADTKTDTIIDGRTAQSNATGTSAIATEQKDIRSLYDKTTVNASLQQMQPWLHEYIEWHRAVRRQFPGSQLLDHPDAPNLLIKICFKRTEGDSCAGLHDRMRNLPQTVFLAAQTQRVFLVKWFHPFPLEEFLHPNLLDWTVPSHNSTATNENHSTTAPISNLIHDRDYLASRQILTKWNDPTMNQKKYHNPLIMLREDPDVSREKVIVCNGRSKTARPIDADREKLNISEPDDEFGTLWHTLFRPSPAVERDLLNVMTRNHLVVQHYIATHCRVRHPVRRHFVQSPKTLFISKDNSSTTDDAGLVFAGTAKDMMIDIGTHAIECSKLLLQKDKEESIYFFSDSEDLVHYMTAEHNLERDSNNIINYTSSEERWHAVKVTTGRVVGSTSGTENSKPTEHLDAGHGTDPSDYYGTFLDLYIGIASRCVSYGFGNYAVLGTRISNTHCLQTHERLSSNLARQWGSDPDARGAACPIPMYANVSW